MMTEMPNLDYLDLAPELIDWFKGKGLNPGKAKTLMCVTLLMMSQGPTKNTEVEIEKIIKVLRSMELITQQQQVKH